MRCTFKQLVNLSKSMFRIIYLEYTPLTRFEVYVREKKPACGNFDVLNVETFNKLAQRVR